MTDFTISGQPNARVNQQRILPTAVKPASIAQINLTNSDASIVGPILLPNGGTLGITSVLTNQVNPNFRLGALPYAIAYFQDNLNALTSIIGYNGGVGSSGYNLYGPLAMPTFTPLATTTTGGGNDGNNMIFISQLTNNTGGDKIIYVITNTRVITPLGGIS